MNLNNTMKISVIMVDGSFRERFDSVDYFCAQSLDPDEYEVIWIEYFDNVDKRLRDKQSKYRNFRIITLNRSGEYHSSYCFNRGIVESRGELLVVPDADVVVERDFLHAVRKEHEQCDRLAMYLYRYNEPRDQHVEPVDLEHLKRVCRMTNPNNFGGCLTVRKKWLLFINGYEQNDVFKSGFHANGADIASRFKAIGLHIMWHPELKLFHPYHEYSSDSTLNYKIQHVIITHRRNNLSFLPFAGLDPTRNVALPDSLREEIQLTMNQSKSDRSITAVAKGLARKFLQRVSSQI